MAGSPNYPSLRLTSAARMAALAILVASAYVVAARIGLALTMQPHPVSTLWPPNAVLLALLLLVPTRAWALVLLSALPAHLAVELHAGIPLPMVLCWFVSNSTEALIGAGLIRRWGGGSTRLDSAERVATFLLAAFLSVFLSSFPDAAFVKLNHWGSGSYWHTWHTRFFSNVLATLTLVPVIASLGNARLAALRQIPARRVVEAVTLFGLLLGVCMFVFMGREGKGTSPALLYAPLPLLLWAAIRFGPAATSGCLLAVALLAIRGAVNGHGPFTLSEPESNAFSIQLFLIVTAIPFMTLAGVVREHTQSREAIRQSEEQLKLALEAAQLGTWEWQLRADRVSWSDKSKEIFGVTDTPDHFTIDRFLGLVSSEDRPSVAATLRRAAEDGAPYETEFRVGATDGEPRWVLAKGEALFDNVGRTTCLLGVNADITERKLAYATLSEWKSRYQAAVESSNQLLYDWDPRTNDVTYGGDLERLIGFSEDEMQGGLQRWMQQIHPDDRAAFQGEIDRVIAEEASFHLSYRYYRKDGQLIWLEDRGQFFRDSAGRVSRMVGFIADVSERTRSEHVLRSSEERFSKAFRSSPDAIMILRRTDGRILEVNSTWERTFGYTRAEAVGRAPESLGLYPSVEDRERLERFLATASRLSDSAVELRTRTGALLQATLSADTVEMAGEPCFITFARDVTARMRAEAEAQEQRHQVAHLGRVAMLGELSGALAHELNQPLTAILANARAAQHLLGNGALDVAELSEILEDIIHDDRRAGDVIDRLRALLRKGDVKPPRCLDINEVVTEVLELVHSDLIQRGVAVEAQLGSALPEVFGDRVQIQQVLLNLILNACDAMGGKSRHERRMTIVTGTTNGKSVELTLTDRGTGIPLEKMAQVFEPFVTTKPHGLGLGLAICRSIVTAHRGELWADNNNEGGATFHLVLEGEVPASV